MSNRIKNALVTGVLYAANVASVGNVGCMGVNAAINEPGDGVVPNISLGGIALGTAVMEQYGRGADMNDQGYDVKDGWVHVGRVVNALNKSDISTILADPQTHPVVRGIVTLENMNPVVNYASLSSRTFTAQYGTGAGRELIGTLAIAYGMSRLRRRYPKVEEKKN